MESTFFPTPTELRSWLEQNHGTARELWVGFYKTASGRPSITWPEAVDQALCYGWIDGVRKGLDEISYMIRFTPRQARSMWSTVNVKRVGELIEMGLVRPPGLEAFQQRAGERSGVYSHEQGHAVQLGEDYEKRLRANQQAWTFFQMQPPSYRKAAIWWVISAKREETRLRRLATLIEDSQHGQRVGPLASPR